MNTLITKTPPRSFTNPPLTPPPTDKKIKSVFPLIVEEIKRRRDGTGSTEAWIEYQLDEKGYKELLRLLESDESLWGFVRDKLRYDFFPAAKRFVLRMPTRVHEVFLQEVVEDLKRQLASIACRRSPSAGFARSITTPRSTDITFGSSQYGSHQPDEQFQYLKSPFPGVVIEVSYSQKREMLGHLANDYILGSYGKIRVVIGLDIEYGRSRKATLSVWRPRSKSHNLGKEVLDVEQVVTNQIFRDDKDNPNNSTEAGLNLQLQDFVPETSIESLVFLHDRISISAAALCEYLTYAEEATRDINNERAISLAADSERKINCLSRARTPAEELKEEDEDKFQEKRKKQWRK